MNLKTFFSSTHFRGVDFSLTFSELKVVKKLIREAESFNQLNFKVKSLKRLILFDKTDFNSEKTLVSRLQKIDNLGKSTTLKAFKIRYGEEQGTKFFKQAFKKVTEGSSKEGYIKRFGKKRGEEEYKYARSSSLKKLKEKFGEAEGLEKWKTKIKKWKHSNTLQGYIDKFGKREGELKWKKRKEKKIISSSLESYISKHGELKGRRLFYSRLEKMWKSTSKDFYLQKENGPELFRKLKDNTSLSFMTGKYGEKEGIEKYKLFCEKMSETAKRLNFASHFDSCQWASKISQDFCWKLLAKIDEADLCYFYDFNGEWFIYDINSKSIKRYDFKYKNVIIEFHGSYWHRDPRIYEETKDTFETRIRDNYKKSLAEKNGFKYFVVWEKDFKDDEEKTIDNCIKLINANEYKKYD